MWFFFSVQVPRPWNMILLITPFLSYALQLSLWFPCQPHASCHTPLLSAPQTHSVPLVMILFLTGRLHILVPLPWIYFPSLLSFHLSLRVTFAGKILLISPTRALSSVIKYLLLNLMHQVRATGLSLFVWILDQGLSLQIEFRLYVCISL